MPHIFETASRAYLLRKRFPGLQVFGGVLNGSVGGLNPQRSYPGEAGGQRLSPPGTHQLTRTESWPATSKRSRWSCGGWSA
jgi:hypothetical protein